MPAQHRRKPRVDDPLRVKVGARLLGGPAESDTLEQLEKLEKLFETVNQRLS